MILRAFLALTLSGCAAAEWPSNAWPIVSGYRDMVNPGGTKRPWAHGGIDILAPRGTAVLAAADGVVERVFENHEIGGRMIWQRALVEGVSLQLRYAHLDRADVREGEKVVVGQQLGVVGTTGEWVAANEPPHLHFAVLGPTGRRDPWPYLRAPDGSVTCAGGLGARLIYPVECTAEGAPQT